MKWKSKCGPRHPGRDGAPGLQGPGRRRGFPGHHAASVPHRATSEDTQQHPAPTLSPQHLRRPPEAAAGAAGGGDRSQDTGPRQAGLDTDNLKDPAQHVSTQHVLRVSGARPHTPGPPGPPLPCTHLWRGRPDTGPASRRQREGTQGATQPASATGSEKNFSRGLSAFLKVSFLRWFRQ